MFSQASFCPQGWRGGYSPPIHGPGILQDTVDKRAVCILLECFLVGRIDVILTLMV